MPKTEKPPSDEPVAPGKISPDKLRRNVSASAPKTGPYDHFRIDSILEDGRTGGRISADRGPGDKTVGVVRSVDGAQAERPSTVGRRRRPIRLLLLRAGKLQLQTVDHGARQTIH